MSELCTTFIDGDWIEAKDQSDSGYRLVQTGNVGVCEYVDKEEHARFVSEDTFKRLNCTEIHPGDILFSRLPDPIGRCCLIPRGFQKAITAVDCTITRLKDSCLPEYLMVYTTTNMYSEQIKTCVTGTTRQRISRGNLAKIQVPLPSTERQQSFVDLVHQADKSKFYGFKSRFISQFGNIAQVTVKEVADEVFAGGDKPDDMSELKNNEYRYPVFSNGIGNNAELGFSRECRVHKQAITVSARGTIGYAEIRDGGFTPVVRLLTLIPKAKYSLPFLKYALNQITYRTSGSSIGQLPVPDFIKLTVPDADLNEQKEFESLYHQADKSKLLN